MSGPTIAPFVQRWGSGERARVLLIHGLSASSGQWWRIAPQIASLGCTVVAADLRGHGSSPPAESYTFEELSSDLEQLGDHWDLIIGHSLGGPVACALAARLGSVGALLLLDPFMDAADGTFDTLVSDQLSELDPMATADSIREQHPDWHPEDCFRKAISARLTSPQVVERCLGDNAPYHHLGLLEELSVPVSILGSDPHAGSLFDPESMRRVRNSFVDYRMVPGAGHSIQREHPEAIVDAARSLLDLVTSGRGRRRLSDSP